MLEAEIPVKITLHGNFLAGTHGFMCFLRHELIPSPLRDFRRREPAGTGKFTCGFFRRFPAGTLCVPSPMPFPNIRTKHIVESSCAVFINNLKRV